MRSVNFQWLKGTPVKGLRKGISVLSLSLFHSITVSFTTRSYHFFSDKAENQNTANFKNIHYYLDSSEI